MPDRGRCSGAGPLQLARELLSLVLTHFERIRSPTVRTMNLTSFKAYFVLHLSISAFSVSGILREGEKIASENAIPRGLDLNKFPEEDRALENGCSSQQITSPQMMEKLDDQSSALDTEGIAKTPLALQQFTSHAIPESTSQDHGGKPLVQEVISDTYFSGDSRKRQLSASTYRTNPKHSKQRDTAIEEASAGSRNQERNVDNDFALNPEQKQFSSGEEEEGYHEIEEQQHLNVGASVSNLPHSSAGVISQKGQQAMADSKGKAQEKELGPETSRDDKALFNVNDWNFLRDPENTTRDEHLEQFLSYVKKCRGHKESQQFFLADKEQIAKFMFHFRAGRRNFFSFPSEMSEKWRVIEIFKTALRISDKRINLESYSIFSKELIEEMSLQIELNSKRSKEGKLSRGLGVRVQFVKDVTKVTQLLSVIYLSLFKGNEHEVVTVKQVESTLESLKNLWWEIEAGNKQLISMGWALRVHHILTYQVHDYPGYDLVSNKFSMYQICWKFLHHLLKKTEKCSIAHMGQESDDKLMVELINKMIFFANYQRFCNSFTEVSSKKEKYKKD